jgi:hypothetical protein
VEGSGLLGDGMFVNVDVNVNGSSKSGIRKAEKEV